MALSPATARSHPACPITHTIHPGLIDQGTPSASAARHGLIQFSDFALSDTDEPIRLAVEQGTLGFARTRQVGGPILCRSLQHWLTC
jgi:hypothetical protein